MNLIDIPGHVAHFGGEVTARSGCDARGEKTAGARPPLFRNQAYITIRANGHAAHIAAGIFLPQQRTALSAELKQEEMRNRARLCRTAHPAPITARTVIRFGREERMQLDCLEL